MPLHASIPEFTPVSFQWRSIYRVVRKNDGYSLLIRYNLPKNGGIANDPQPC
jgi:hypothetical protein